MLTEADIEYYIRAGRIACTVRKEVENYISAGTRLLDIAEFIEKRILELGGEPAFPTNISINNIAAHYTPTPGDQLTVPENAVVKIDIGVHVEGYIADTATTVSLAEKYRALVEAAKEALEKALTFVLPGRRFSDVGSVIENTIKTRGFKPIYNLSGHSIDRYSIHAGETIPNYRDRLNLGKFRQGKVYALEPFATNGSGFVVDTPTITIYALRYNPKKIRYLSKDVRDLYSYIYDRRRGLPFAKRWLLETFDGDVIEKALKEFESNGLLITYPVLIEKSSGTVTQFEHTVVIDKSGQVIITTDC
uniref:Methionine aminopeptidase n=1 Tax=Ignisphaera aggregans TaxID=334771 RepID=A0A7C2Z8K6_9CREN